MKSLQAFEAAAHHANFARAAAQLAVTPSAISHHVQTLEAFLGVRLFLRRAGHVTLTTAGNAYRIEVEAALRALAEATQRIAPQTQQDTLTILSSPGFAAKWLQPRLPGFMAIRPGVRIRIATMADAASLTQTRFDVAICYGAPELPGMNVMPFLAEQVRPLCSPSLVRALGLRAVADLARATLIHSANSVTWDAFFRHIGAVGLRSGNELWIDRSSMAIDAAVAGLGVILESDLLTELERQEGRLVAPFDSRTSISANSYHLVTPRGYRSRHHCAAFSDWLYAMAKSAPAAGAVA